MKTITIYSTTTGDVLRWVSVLNDADAGLQAKAGEGVLQDVKGDHITDKVDLSGKPQLVQRSAEEIAARRITPQVEADPVSVLVALLKAKGINVTDADLAAAKTAAKVKAVKP